MGLCLRIKIFLRKPVKQSITRLRPSLQESSTNMVKKLYLVSNTFPSTQMCSNCGKVKQGKKETKVK